MKRFLSLILAILIMIPSVAFGQVEKIQEENQDLLFFQQILNYIESRHPFPIEEGALIRGGVKGMLQAVDPYSDYYTPEEAEELYGSIDGEFSGIGVYIEEKDGFINITGTIKDQPAEKAGLKKDDLIISVGKENIKGLGLRKVSSMIRGPVGTSVELGIKRGKQNLTLIVPRSTIVINSIEYEILEKDIGYIKMKDFSEGATKETKKALKEFDNKNIKKVILDLRDNPGGLLDEGIKVSELFVPRGSIVHIREKGKGLVTHSSTLEKSKYKLAVLVNENSASAAEIVAGAIKDRKAGALVGMKTFGKGTVQTMMTLGDGSMIKLTIAEYLTPNQISINGIGIEPNYMVENTEEDLQLKKAMEILK